MQEGIAVNVWQRSLRFGLLQLSEARIGWRRVFEPSAPSSHSSGCLISASVGLLICLPNPNAFSQPAANSHDSRQALGKIMSKLGPPSKTTLATFVDSGMQGIRDHQLTSDERKTVENAVASLPPLYQKILDDHLNQLSFVDGIPGDGTGLTESLNAPKKTFNLTFRAAILHESSSNFLTWKEQRCFSLDGSGTRVSINAAQVPGFTYVLFHEATHVTDFVLGISKNEKSPFHTGIWAGTRELSPQYAKTLVARDVFRHGNPTPARKAPELYQSLATTPFVSLYALASESEDLAELSAYYLLWTDFHVSPRIEVISAQGKLIYAYEPAKSASVQSRFLLVNLSYSAHGRDSAADVAQGSDFV